MRKLDASKGYPSLIGKLRYSPSKEAVMSLERIKKRRKGTRELKGIIDFV